MRRQDTSNGKKRVLLVDDDYLVGNMTKELLERFGYWIDFRTDPTDALCHFRQNPYGFDMVITDMIMPIMTGEELAFEIRKIRKDMPVILCTGHSVSLSKEKALKTGIEAVLMKPLTMSALEKVIGRVIEDGEKTPGRVSAHEGPSRTDHVQNENRSEGRKDG